MQNRTNFFTFLQKPTDKLLLKYQNTYIADYIPEKIMRNPNISFDEENIIEIVGNYFNDNVHKFIAGVMDYKKLVDDIERSDFKKKENTNISKNKEIDKIDNDNVNIHIPITYLPIL